MKAKANGPCEARRYSDQMQCSRCGLAYDVNDPDPPECGKTTQRQQRGQHNVNDTYPLRFDRAPTL